MVSVLLTILTVLTVVLVHGGRRTWRPRGWSRGDARTLASARVPRGAHADVLSAASPASETLGFALLVAAVVAAV